MTDHPTRRQALTAEALSSLGSKLVRTLCQMLIVERGLWVTRVQPRNEHDDIYISTAGLWRTRAGLVRVVHRPLENRDVESLAEVARSQALADAVLVEGHSGTIELQEDQAVQIVRAHELVEHVRASALVEWHDGQPRPARGRFALVRDLSQIAVALDPVGLRWLPTLALNHVPPELEGAGTADELLERIAFRILTTALRFDGQRFGARRRGQRVPDAVLRWKDRSALLDCKAAQYGYRMGIDDQRALVEYHRSLKAGEEEAGFALEYIIVMSSDFDGEQGKNHPYYQRAESIKNECGATLVYLRASDIVRLMIEIESDEAEPAARQSIDWVQIFDLGMPSPDQVVGVWR